MKFPSHKCSLSICHNDHKDYYDTAIQWIDGDGKRFQWKSEEAKQIAINTDSIWTIQWYPETPIGFYAIAAPTFEELLEFSEEVENAKR